MNTLYKHQHSQILEHNKQNIKISNTLPQLKRGGKREERILDDDNKRQNESQ